MNIVMRGGPYAGLVVTALDLLRHTTIMALKSSAGTRRFVFLPAPADWPRVLAGSMKVKDSEAFHYYELVSTPSGLVLVYDASRERYWAAINRAIREMPDRNGTVGHG